ALHRLASHWLRLCRQLHGAGLVHGDLEHGNILVSNDTAELRLVDYDTFHLAGTTPEGSRELGHPNYQHPERQRVLGFSAAAERFSQLVIYAGLRCLALGDRSLWERYDTGDNLLFRAEDFAGPRTSPLLQELSHAPEP